MIWLRKERYKMNSKVENDGRKILTKKKCFKMVFVSVSCFDWGGWCTEQIASENEFMKKFHLQAL